MGMEREHDVQKELCSQAELGNKLNKRKCHCEERSSVGGKRRGNLIYLGVTLAANKTTLHQGRSVFSLLRHLLELDCNEFLRLFSLPPDDKREGDCDCNGQERDDENGDTCEHSSHFPN